MLESVTETRAIVLFEDVDKLRFPFGIFKTRGCESGDSLEETKSATQVI